MKNPENLLNDIIYSFPFAYLHFFLFSVGCSNSPCFLINTLQRINIIILSNQLHNFFNVSVRPTHLTYAQSPSLPYSLIRWFIHPPTFHFTPFNLSNIQCPLLSSTLTHALSLSLSWTRCFVPVVRLPLSIAWFVFGVVAGDL